MNKTLIRLPLAAAIILMSGHASATNGYFTHGIGTHNKAMAGAGTASPSQAIDVANNPAAGILVGEQMDVGLGLFVPKREYSPGPSMINGNFGAFSLGEGTVESTNDKHLIPYLAYSWRWDENSMLTGLVYGRGGMNTSYNDGSATFDPDGPGPAPIMTLDGTYGAGKTGVNLAQGFMEVAYSWTNHEGLALGISPMLAVQAFDIDGVNTFAPYTATFARSGGTQFPNDLSGNGHDISWGLGVRLGGVWQMTEAVAVAMSYQTKIHMQEFDKYQDLFAQEGSFDIPATLRAGISLAATDNIKFHFDVEKTWFNDVDSVGNPLSHVFNCPTAGGMDIESCGGGQNGFGFGWDDVLTYKFGLEWRPEGMDHLTLRAGYSTTEQPVQKDDVLVGILAPAVVEEHFTAGFAYRVSETNELSVALMYAPEHSVTGTNAFDPTQQIELSMKQFDIEVSYSFK